MSGSALLYHLNCCKQIHRRCTALRTCNRCSSAGNIVNPQKAQRSFRSCDLPMMPLCRLHSQNTFQLLRDTLMPSLGSDERQAMGGGAQFLISQGESAQQEATSRKDRPAPRGQTVLHLKALQFSKSSQHVRYYGAYCDVYLFSDLQWPQDGLNGGSKKMRYNQDQANSGLSHRRTASK